jgi:hypothetical protein
MTISIACASNCSPNSCSMHAEGGGGGLLYGRRLRGQGQAGVCSEPFVQSPVRRNRRRSPLSALPAKRLRQRGYKRPRPLPSLECSDLIRSPLLCLACVMTGMQTGSDLCLICYVEELRAAPCVQLGCGHFFHFECTKSKIANGWSGKHHTHTHTPLTCA